MAEVTGDIGGSSVVLNNAATESTLRELLAAMKALAAAQGKGGASASKEVERLAAAADEASKNGKKFSQETKRSYLAHKENTAAVEDNTDAQSRLADAAGLAYKGMGKLATASLGAVKALGNIAGTVANLGNSFTAVADTFAALPFGAGELVGSVFKPVADAADKVYNGFQQTASVGANFGGSINEMVNAATSAGLTIDDFGTALTNSGESLRYLGGSTEEGAKRLAQLGKQLRSNVKDYGGLNTTLARLGYTTQDTIEATAKMARDNAIFNRGKKISDQELLRSTGEYLKNLDAVSKLTGKSKEALEAEYEARLTDSQFLVATRNMQADDAKRLSLYMSTLGPEMGDAFKEMVARGNMSGEATQKLMETNPVLAKQMLEAARTAKKSGEFSADAMASLDRQVVNSSKAMVDNQKVVTQATYAGDRYGATFVDMTKAASRNADDLQRINDSIAKQADAAEKGEGVPGGGRTAEELKAAQERIAEVSNSMVQTLANSQAFDKMMVAFDEAGKFMEEHMADALDFVTDNLWLLAAAAVAATLGIGKLPGKIGKMFSGKGKGISKTPGGGGNKLAEAGKTRTPSTKVPGSADDIAKKAGTKAATQAGTQAATQAGTKAATTAATQASAKTATTAATTAAGKTAAKTVAKVLGPVAIAGMAIYDGVSGWNEAAELMGKEKDAEVTTGEKASATAGNIISGLTFGLVDAKDASKGIADFFGAGSDADRMARLEEKIAAEKERVARSDAGENEYIGPEQLGRAMSKTDILNWEKELNELKAKQKVMAEPKVDFSTLPPKPLEVEVTGSPNQPKTDALSPQKSLEQDAAAKKKAAEEAAKAAEEKAKEAAGAVSGSVDGASLQKQQADQLAQLNNNISELVRLTRDGNNISKKQLGATAGMTGDLFASA